MTTAPRLQAPGRPGRPGRARPWSLLSATVLVLVLVLAGCASPGRLAPPLAMTSAEALGLGSASATTASAVPADAPGPALPWWQRFGEPRLDALVERALAGQPGLQQAHARLRRAASGVAALQASTAPQVNATLDATRQRYSENSIVPAPLAGSVRTLAGAQVGLSWELDLFGRQQQALDAGLSQQQAARADLQAARELLAGQVTQAYVQLALLLDQQAVVGRTLAQRSELLALVQQRVGAGLDSTLALRQSEAALPEARGLIHQLGQAIALQRHRLAALSAQPPDALSALQPSLDTLQSPALPEQIPIDLLGRRADVAAARWRVEAASQDMAVARLQFYPNLNLNAFAGLASIGLDRLLLAGSTQAGVGPALRLPLFDGGRLRANLQGRAADLDLAVAGYNGVVLGAVHQVADQISSLRSLHQQQQEQQQAAAAAAAAFDLVQQRYQSGLSDHLQLLLAESAVLTQRRNGLDLVAQALQAQAALASALGGGPEAAAAPARPLP